MNKYVVSNAFGTAVVSRARYYETRNLVMTLSVQRRIAFIIPGSIFSLFSMICVRYRTEFDWIPCIYDTKLTKISEF